MHWEYHFMGIHLLWWVFWIVLLIVLIGGFSLWPERLAKKDSPLDILQKRFASGEISTDEYEEKKRILESDSKKAAK